MSTTLKRVATEAASFYAEVEGVADDAEVGRAFDELAFFSQDLTVHGGRRPLFADGRGRPADRMSGSVQNEAGISASCARRTSSTWFT